MRRIIWSALAAAVLLVWTCGPVVAQGNGPTMHITVGFDGYCRRDGWCPVHVLLSNEGADVEGEFRAAVRGVSSSTERDVYVKPVLLPAHSRKAFFLYLPRGGLASQFQMVSGEEILASQSAGVRLLDENDRLYGIASSSSSALNFLSDVAPAGGNAAVAHLGLDKLPPTPLVWELLDVLILNDVDTTALSSEQRQALETWVAHGGHLIVGGGVGAARTVAGLADLLPVTVDGTRSVDDLWALGGHAAPGPYAIAEVTLQEGEALIEQKDEQRDLILLARRTFGAGKVDFLAFDAGLNPFVHWDDNVQMWEFITEGNVADMQLLTVRNGYGARDAINSIPGLELPSTLQILAFMLVYTLLIGPANYFVLRKLDRRELAWLTIPALVVGFTVLAYATGFQIRGTAAIVHRLAVVHVPAGHPSASEETGGKTGRVSQLVGLFSPRRTTYDVRVQDAQVHQMPGDYYYGGPAAQPLHVTEEAGGSTVTDLRVDVGGIRPFVAEGYVDAAGVKTDLQLVTSETGDLQVKGTLTTAGRLEGAVLLAGRRQQRLGDLEPGQVTTISIQATGGTLPSSYYYTSQLPEQILGPGNYWEDRNLYRRYQFLQAIFVAQGSSVIPTKTALAPGLYLIGWTEEQVPLPVEVVGRDFSTVETALYVYDLPVVGLETGTTVTIPPDLIERQIEETIGSVDVWPEGFHMEPEAEVVFRFTVWPGVTVSQVNEMVLDMQGSSGHGSLAYPPTVSLWNQESEEWDVLEDIGWGKLSVPNAAVYVTSGEVLLRLETGTEWQADVENLTITIEGQR
ncbi:MAG: hypothetical protein SXV54_01810 [Chloroflexota bacterium]|nr:hypothetical protein [Chloroflexota bacterium]